MSAANSESIVPNPTASSSTVPTQALKAVQGDQEDPENEMQSWGYASLVVVDPFIRFKVLVLISSMC